MTSLSSTEVRVSVLVIACCSAVFYNVGFEIGTQNELKKKYGFLRSEMIKDTAAFVCAQSKFMEADSYFDELSQEEEEASNSISQSLRVAECYAQQGRKMKADIAIRATKRLLLTSNFVAIYQSAKNFTQDSSCFRMGILLKTASDLTISDTSLHRDLMYARINYCKNDIYKCITKNNSLDRKLDDINMNYVVPTAEEMFVDIQATQYEGHEIKAYMDLLNAEFLSLVHISTGKHKKSIMYSEIVVQIFEKEFAKDAAKQNHYADAKTMIADNYFYLNKPRKAEFYYSEALHTQKNFPRDNSVQQKIEEIVKKMDFIQAAEYKSTRSEFSRLFSKK